MNQVVMRRQFADVFKPATAEQIINLIDVIKKQYPNTAINLKSYLLAMSPYPRWALQKAVLDLSQGRVSGVDASFCPPAPKVAQITHELVEKRRKYLVDQMRKAESEAETRRLLNAPKKKDEAMRKRVNETLARFHQKRADDGFGVDKSNKPKFNFDDFKFTVDDEGRAKKHIEKLNEKKKSRAGWRG